MLGLIYRRRRRAVSGGGGGTTYTNAMRFDSIGDIAEAAAHAAYADLTAFTVAVLVRWDGVSGTGAIVSKGAGWSYNNASTTLGDFSGACATNSAFKRDSTIATDNSWVWLFFGWDRAARQVTRAIGPMGGTIADIGAHLQADGGSAGAPTTEGAGLRLGNSALVGAGAYNMEVRFLGIASGIMSLANMQALSADAVGQASLVIDYWKPGASDTTQVPSGKGVLPALVYSGATLV